MNTRRIALIVIGLSVAAATLTGCGSEKTAAPVTQVSPAPTPEPVPSSGVVTGTVDELEPGTAVDDKPIVDMKNPPVVPKPSTPPVSKDAAPEKPGTETGKLPENFEMPTGATIFEPASVIRGDRSFLALDFETSWEETATLLKASLKQQGWVCTNCVDYPASFRGEDEQEWRYLLTMEREGRTLNGVVTVRGKKSSASLNFRP